MSDKVVVLEETKECLIDWEKLKKISSKVIPVAVQDIESKEVLLIGYVNKEALLETLKTGVAVFYSTSRNKLWVKGESSGNKLIVKDVRINCEQNSLLYLVELSKGGACHVKRGSEYRKSCYYRRLSGDGAEKLEFIS